MRQDKMVGRISLELLMLDCHMRGSVLRIVILAFITAAKYVSFKNNPHLHQHKLQSANSNVCFSGPTLLALSAALGTVDGLSS